MKEPTIYGQHVTLDLSGCEKKHLGDMEFCFVKLKEIAEGIGMECITQPCVIPYSGNTPEDAGITAFVIIAESHISIHTYTEKRFIFVDVFSCRPFDEKAVEEFFVDSFGARKSHMQKLIRGIDFPS